MCESKLMGEGMGVFSLQFLKINAMTQFRVCLCSSRFEFFMRLVHHSGKTKMPFFLFSFFFNFCDETNEKDFFLKSHFRRSPKRGFYGSEIATLPNEIEIQVSFKTIERIIPWC